MLELFVGVLMLGFFVAQGLLVVSSLLVGRLCLEVVVVKILVLNLFGTLGWQP